MKVIIFSDTHLGQSFDKKKFEFLKKVILSGDKIIIAGDFWEGKLISFDAFLKSEWRELFPLLKKKKTVYIYGNHDEKNTRDKRVSFFSSIQTESYKFSIGNKKFIVEHGDAYIKKTPLPKFILDNKLFMKFFHLKLEELLVKIFGRVILQRIYGRYNKKIKKKILAKTKHGEMFIFGHTHAAEIDLERNFINTGIIRHGVGQYVVIDEESASLRSDSY